jgi:hypothetical protein
MKLIKRFSVAFALSGLLFTVSCNQGEEKKEETPVLKADTTAVMPAEQAKPVKPKNMVIIKHKVANFEKWLPGFEAHDTARLRYGLHNFVIGRGVKDSNMVMVALWMDDYAKAKEFTLLPDLKAAMQKGGVIGKPEIHFMDMQMLDTSTEVSPIRLMITHMVKDFAAWQTSFESHKQVRLDAGMTDRALGYEMDNNKTVSVVTVVNDMAKAEAFIASKDLKDKMQAAGVEGPPALFFYKMAKKY